MHGLGNDFRDHSPKVQDEVPFSGIVPPNGGLMARVQGWILENMVLGIHFRDPAHRINYSFLKVCDVVCVFFLKIIDTGPCCGRNNKVMQQC